MSSCTCCHECFALEHYLRMATRKPSHWLSSLQVLTGCPRLSQEIGNPDDHGDFFARLSFLPARLTNLCGIYLNSPVKIFGTNAAALAIIVPLRGSVEFKVDGRHFLCAAGVPYVLESGVEFCASVSEAADIFIVQLKPSDLTESNARPKSGDPKLAAILENYLAEMPFFRNHDHAMARTRNFEQALTVYSKASASYVVESSGRATVSDERRITQALNLINERLEQGVDLESVARDSGLSLRNFYYLMNKFTGMAPYTYCRSRRLIKARESLINSYNDEPGIAKHARKWGFKHQGRFSAYYLKHFNEHPSQTLGRLRYLTKKSQKVIASENRLKAWYTSTTPSSVEKPDMIFSTQSLEEQ